MKKVSSIISLVNSIWFLIAAVIFFLNLFIYGNSGNTENGEGIAIAIILIISIIGIPVIAAIGISGIVLSSICIKKSTNVTTSYKVMSIVLIILDILQAVIYGYVIIKPDLWKINYTAISVSFIISVILSIVSVALKVIDLSKLKKEINVIDNN